jgi:hypothetical protein
MTPEDHRRHLETNTRAAFLRRRLDAAAAGHSATPVPTTRMFVVEDPSKFAPGHVVVEDGKKRRMMICKIVANFAECVWFTPIQIGNTAMPCPRFDIFHTSMLTLDADQKWIAV